LIDDAAYLMTPFAREGVNVAMLDALELAEIVKALKIKVESGDTLTSRPIGREGEVKNIYADARAIIFSILQQSNYH
jgi:hypothetical protein